MSHWEVLEYTCDSDHNNIQMHLHPHVKYDEIINPKWIFKTANWKLFSDMCDTMSKINFNDDIENINENITVAMFKAAGISILRSKGTGKKKTVSILAY